MSISPYNNFTVRDLSNVQQPYINSTSEFGYFNGSNLGTIAKDKWYSLPASLNTNNGIASVAANGGLILNPGVYKINLSLFPTATQDGSSNISFNFGTTYLSNIATTSSASAFGGPRPTGMFTLDVSNNPYSPGIISWVADGYSSANSTNDNFVKNSTTNELSYNYFNAGYPNRTLYSSIFTTKMTFILKSSATIFFNISTNSNTGVTMGNSCFTLQFICSNPIINWPDPIWTTISWSKGIGAPNTVWHGNATSSTGQYVVAAGFNPIGIYRSSDYGVNWTQLTNAPAGINWFSISSDSTGQYLASGTYGGNIRYSLNSGELWQESTGAPNAQWGSITSNSTGQYLAAVTVATSSGIYYSSDYGANWSIRNGTSGLNFAVISSSSTGQYLVAGRVAGNIYVSTDYGSSWTPRNTAVSTGWGCVATSSSGQYMFAGVGYTSTGSIYRSTDFGTTWETSYNSNFTWTGITSSSTGKYLAAVTTNGFIYLSKDFGSSWLLSTNNAEAVTTYKGISSSSSGQYITIGSGGGGFGMYTGVYSQ